jgi:hypothetical protein
LLLGHLDDLKSLAPGRLADLVRGRFGCFEDGADLAGNVGVVPRARLLRPRPHLLLRTT